MKKIIILVSLIVSLIVSGCGIYNLSYFVMPDDLEFLEVIENLDTPKKICAYMEENFEWVLNFNTYSPYQMWSANRAGDCNDFSSFAIWVADYHGYEVYQIRVREVFFRWHLLGVFVENGFYTSSSNMYYYPWLSESFEDVVKIHYGNDYMSYKVYDYDMNIIETGYKRR